MFNDDVSKQICKIGGPFVLFVCWPFLVYVSYELSKADLVAGTPLPNKWILEMLILNSAFLFVGLYSTYKGYEEKFKK